MPKPRTGTLRQRKPGVWQLIVSIEKKQRLIDNLTKMDRLGQRIVAHRERLYETFHGTEAEAQARLAALQAESEDGEPTAGTIAAMLAYWLRTEQHRWKAATVVKYEGLVRHHIAPFIGERSVAGFTKVDGKGFYATLRENGRTENTVRFAHKVLSIALTSAVDDEVLERNPVDRVKLGKITVQEVKPPDEHQVNDMLALARESGLWWYPAIRLAAYTGMRRGEVMGLLWRNINLAKGFLDVCQSLTHVRGKLHIDTPKTSSERRVELDALSIDILLDYKRAQEAHIQAMGSDYVDQGIVFCKPDGGYFNPAAFSETVAKISRLTGPRMKGHALRHYHVSMWLSRQAPLLPLSRRLGHASLKMTLDVYGHLMPEAQRAGLDIFMAGETNGVTNGVMVSARI